VSAAKQLNDAAKTNAASASELLRVAMTSPIGS
jgi:hypothetical protein